MLLNKLVKRFSHTITNVSLRASQALTEKLRGLQLGLQYSLFISEWEASRWQQPMRKLHWKVSIDKVQGISSRIMQMVLM